MKAKIRTPDGGSEEVEITPLKAIRARCLDCSGWNSADVRRCDFEDCELWPYRFGKRAKSPNTPVQGIRRYCLWCCAGSAHEVKLCPSQVCALHLYRLGKNPAMADRKGNADAFASIENR